MFYCGGRKTADPFFIWLVPWLSLLFPYLPFLLSKSPVHDIHPRNDHRQRTVNSTWLVRGDRTLPNEGDNIHPGEQHNEGTWNSLRPLSYSFPLFRGRVQFFRPDGV